MNKDYTTESVEYLIVHVPETQGLAGPSESMAIEQYHDRFKDRAGYIIRDLKIHIAQCHMALFIRYRTPYPDKYRSLDEIELRHPAACLSLSSCCIERKSLNLYVF